MNKKVCLLTLGLLAGNAFSASATVWDATNGNGTVPPTGGWYKYANETTDVATLTNATAGKSVAVTVSTTKQSSAAGMGVTMAKSGVKDLSDYEGVCLTYSATQKFRFDVKTSAVEDYDYNGVILPAKSKQDTVYVAFSSLEQEGWGASVAFDPSDVQGLQFSYKQSIAAETKSTKNTIVVSSITLGSSCTNHPPVLSSTYAGYNGKTLDVAEGAIHEIPLADVFVDEDGDEMTYTVKMSGAEKAVVLLDTAKTFTMKDVLHFTTVSNPVGDVDVVITAKDSRGNTKDFTFTIHTEDVENAPVAKDFAIEVPEDSFYKSSLGGRLLTYGSDADGDKFTVIIVDQPAHGTLDVDASAIFTYTPDENYNGKDSFTYRFVETTAAALESNLGTCTITVTPVNDAPVVKFSGKTFEDGAGKEYSYGDTLVVDEDFAAFSVYVSEESISVTDIDGDDDIVIGAKASGVVTANLLADDGFYEIKFTAIKDANGVAKVSLTAGDHQITKTQVLCYVKVNDVLDPPSVKDDEYTIPQDSLFKVSAKNGVLANDPNPDSVKVKAVLDAEAEHGVVTLADDGSFTYESDPGYEGDDYFGYVISYGEDEHTEMGIVTIHVVYRNHAPTIVEGVLDTVGKRLSALREDFTSIPKFTKAEIQSWFVDDQDAATALTFSVRSDDSLLAPTYASGTITVKSVKDACGDAEIIVTAKDKGGATTDLRIPASISCVNDKPVLLAGDTVYVPTDSAFSFVVDLTKYVSDPDGDELEYTFSRSNVAIDVEIEGDSMIVTAKEGYRYGMETTIGIVLKVSDPSGLYVTANVIVKFGDDPKSIKPVIAAPKANWQNAILANRGMAAIFDMQGRVMWKQKLPVSEAEVRAAASQVQGRKILQVNKQVFTIK